MYIKKAFGKYSCFVWITQFLSSFLEAIRFPEPKWGHGMKYQVTAARCEYICKWMCS